MKKQTLLYIFYALVIISFPVILILHGQEDMRTRFISDEEIEFFSYKEILNPVKLQSLYSSGINYDFLSNGLIEIKSGNKTISHLGFGVSGKIDGANYRWTSENFNWSSEKIGDTLTVNNNNILFPWTAQFTTKPYGQKITHNLTNNIGKDITNAKFWYIQTVPEGTQLRYGGKSYVLSFNKSNVHFTDLEDKNVRNKVIVAEKYIIDFSDLVRTGFNITEVFIGNGSILGHPSKLIMAFGVTKNNGLFPDGATISFDPALMNNSAHFPNATGTIHSDWDNHANLKADDGVFSDPDNEGELVTVSNFSILESEGGTLSDNFGAIMGIEIVIDTFNTCIGIGGDYDLDVVLSGDGGATWTSENYTRRYTCGVGTLPHGSDFVNVDYRPWGKTDWDLSDFTNGNFMVRVNLSKIIESGSPTGTINPRIDYISLAVAYTDGPVNNVSHSSDEFGFGLGSTKIYRLAISNLTVAINKSNIIIYSPFDWDDDRVPNYDYRANPGDKGASLGTDPIFVQDGGKFGSAYDFTDDNIGYFAEDIYELTEFTACAWINRDETSTSQMGNILVKGRNNVAGYRLYVPADGTGGGSYDPIIAVRNTSGTTASCQVLTGTANGDYHHFCGAYNGSGLAIYKDGALSQSCPNTITGPLRIDNDFLFIGNGKGPRGGFVAGFEGLIDEVILTNTALTSQQILRLYDGVGKVLFPAGTKEFTDLNFSGNDTMNLTSLVEVPSGTALNISIGDSSGGSYVYGDQIVYSSGSADDINLASPDNVSIRFHFYPNTERLTSPLLNGSLDETTFDSSFIATVWKSPDSCAYTSGNYVVDCSDNCAPTSNIDVDAGFNFTLIGAGNYTLDGVNLTGFIEFFHRGNSASDICHLRKFNGAVFGR